MKSNSNVLKIMLVIVLAVAVAAFAVGSPTFSWFLRPGTSTGNALDYGIAADDNITAYDGSSVTMETFVSNDDGITFSTTAANPDTSGTLSPSSRVYYKTVLTNSNTTKEQNVSLYIRNLVTGSSGQCCVGTNVPVKSFKNYTEYDVQIPDATKTLKPAPNSVKRIYFKAGGNNASYDNQSTGWSNGNYYACSVDTSVIGHSIDDNNNQTGKHYTQFHKIGSGSDTSSVYYADIPATDEELFISVANWNGTDYKRTQTFRNLTGTGLTKTQSLYFELNGTYTGYKNAWSKCEKCVGANIASYYGEIVLAKTSTHTQTVNVGLTLNTHYSGASVSGATIRYSSSDSDVFTVDANGVITAVGEGNAILTYTVTSQYGESATQDAVVNVNRFSGSQTIKAAPIVTNLVIPPATTENVNEKKNQLEVYWFIQNGDDMYSLSAGNVEYELDGIYLGV